MVSSHRYTPLQSGLQYDDVLNILLLDSLQTGNHSRTTVLHHSEDILATKLKLISRTIL